jgi:uncharacterized protein (TIGR03083 family)
VADDADDLDETNELGRAYRDLRLRVIALLGDAGPEVAAIRSKACPEWTVHHLVAHLTGECQDILDGRLDGVGTDPWTAAQVERLADQDLAALLADWGERGPGIDAIMPFFPGDAAAQLLFDVTTHEQDIRGAIDRPGGRDASSVVLGLGFLVRSLDAAIRANGWPTLQIHAEGHTWVLGDPPVANRLDADLFTLMRSFGGRRSLDQIRALDWTGDPEPYLGVFTSDSPVRPPIEPLIE